MVHGRVNFPAFSGATAPKRVICITVIHSHTDTGIMSNTIIGRDISIITILVITDDPSTQTMPGIGQRHPFAVPIDVRIFPIDSARLD